MHAYKLSFDIHDHTLLRSEKAIDNGSRDSYPYKFHIYWHLTAPDQLKPCVNTILKRAEEH